MTIQKLHTSLVSCSTANRSSSHWYVLITNSLLLETQKHVQQLREVRSFQSGNRVPTGGGNKTSRAAGGVVAHQYIIESIRILVKYRIDESNRSFTSSNPLLIDSVQNRSKDWGGCTCTSDQSGVSIGEDQRILTIGGDIGVTSAASVVDASSGTDGNVVDSTVVGVVLDDGIGNAEVVVDSLLLPVRGRIEVAEPSS